VYRYILCTNVLWLIYFIKLFYSHANYSYIVVRLISFRICLHLADILHNLHPFVDSAEHGMFVIQPRLKIERNICTKYDFEICIPKKMSDTHRWCQCDEELTTVRIRSCVSHAQSIRSIVLQVRLEFIFELAAPYAFTAGAGSGRIARLYHEALDNSMKYMTVIVTVLRVYAEIFHRFRYVFAEEIHVDVTKRCVDDRRVVYLLHVRGLRRRYDVFFRRLFIENISIAFLTFRILGFTSRKHVKSIFLVCRAKQRRVRPVQLYRGILRSLHFDS